MGPAFSTDHKLMTILNELKQLEPIFHHPELGTTRADFENMMADEFWEVGASGRIYNRQYVLDELEKRYNNPVKDVWETKDFNCMEIAPDNYLLTYTLRQGSRITRRSTIWRRTDERWMIVYHQGTPVKEI
jgi:hypothetical protein